VENLLNSRRAAEYLGTSIWFIWDHTRGGKKPILPYIKIGRNSRRFRQADLEKFVESCSVKEIL
jgi:hypothetical protein